MEGHIFINHILKELQIIFQLKGKQNNSKKHLDAEINNSGMKQLCTQTDMRQIKAKSDVKTKMERVSWFLNLIILNLTYYIRFAFVSEIVYTAGAPNQPLISQHQDEQSPCKTS